VTVNERDVKDKRRHRCVEERMMENETESKKESM
jgi:hypothetical protein